MIITWENTNFTSRYLIQPRICESSSFNLLIQGACLTNPWSYHLDDVICRSSLNYAHSTTWTHRLCFRPIWGPLSIRGQYTSFSETNYRTNLIVKCTQRGLGIVAVSHSYHFFQQAIYGPALKWLGGLPSVCLFVGPTRVKPFLLHVLAKKGGDLQFDSWAHLVLWLTSNKGICRGNSGG